MPELSIFDADTLCHAVTLTFNPLTLKVCGTSSVMYSKYVQNLSEIAQSPAELLIICEYGISARSLCQLLKLYLCANLRNTFDGHPLSGC